MLGLQLALALCRRIFAGSLVPPVTNGLLLEDNVSFILLEDGSSVLLLE